MMTITLANHGLVEDLSWHYWRSGFVVDRLGPDAVVVRRPDAPSAEQEWLETTLHLHVWKALNPNVVVDTSLPQRAHDEAQPQD